MDAKKPKILCVDDEPLNLKLLDALLTPRGYEVIRSENGRDALRRIEEQQVDLVLLDVMMPEMNGLEVCRRIKETERSRNIPVVMITALTSSQDRVKGIEAGAEDFISKPFDPPEVIARMRMLLRIKELNDQLSTAYTTVTNMVGFGETMVMTFDPLQFDFLPRIDDIVRHILRSKPEMTGKPEAIIVGFVDDNLVWQWYQFDSVSRELHRTWLRTAFGKDIPLPAHDRTVLSFCNESDLGNNGYQSLLEQLKARSFPVSNMVCFLSDQFCIFALNYGRPVTQFDAEILNSIVLQSLYLRSLASQVKKTEHAFDYLIRALARAAEANDEDTGNHILRVGEYCAVLAKELGMSEKFINIIRTQATLHDVGKIHVPPDILKKPGALTKEEFEHMKLHTVAGAKILGDHVRLTLAKRAALSHHERWDGTGYPYKLRGDEIPLEGRILNLADQYDALRNVRVYKPAFDHQTSYRILTEGDDRTMPYHFDRDVLRAFRETAVQFEEIYERMKG